MKLIPAIDIRGGKCVRLYKGDFAQETLYSDDPVAVALRWQRSGASLLHVVDLDGAREGNLYNLELVASICRSVDIPVQVGGGLRSLPAIEGMLNVGACRVVLGTLAFERPDLLREAIERWGAAIAVALDARDGELTTRGWLGNSGLDALTTAADLVLCGVRCLIYTDIARDGTLEGPDLEGLRALQGAAGPGIEIIASGGIGRLSDLLRLRDTGVSGAIIGKALYTGDIDLAAALKAVDIKEQKASSGNAF